MSASLALRQGESIGDYEVVAPLRSGGMADLYLARKTGAAGFARHVAIKVVHRELAADRSFVELFLDEARLCTQISHPNVVHVEDLGEQDGRYYMVMEYVHGCSLAELMTHFASEGRRPTVRLACHVAIKIAEGLHAAHQARDPRGRRLGVVHRDVSPQNVLLSLSGDVKLIDFGIAKAHGTSQGLGGIAGKLAYMPPEQAFGKPVDPRADIYALGIILWEMLTMERLFSAHDPDLLLDRVRHPAVDSPKAHVPELPDPLADLVMHALAPEVEARLSSAGELSRRLAEIVPGAASLQPSQLSMLLDEVMGDTIARDEARLPSEVTGTVPRRRKTSAPTKGLTHELTQVVGAQATWAPPDSFSDRTGTAATPNVLTLGLGRTPKSVAPPELQPGADWVGEKPRGSRKVVIGAALLLAVVGAAAGVLVAETDQQPEAPAPAIVEAAEGEQTADGAPSSAGDAPSSAEDEEARSDASVATAEAPEADESMNAASPRSRTSRRRRRRAPMMETAQTPAMMTRERIDGVVIVSDFED